jgi:hypothetical protein
MFGDVPCASFGKILVGDKGDGSPASKEAGEPSPVLLFCLKARSD